jgi:hexokinase
MDDLLHEIQTLLESPLESKKLLRMSAQLQEQFAPKLQASDICMLPSYNHKLPSGLELGTYLALDVGGSTFRVALVELTGKQPGAKSMRIVNMKSYRIDESVRSLKGNDFFDWMAEKIEAAIADPQVEKIDNGGKTFGMGLSWSFPIEYVVQHQAPSCCPLIFHLGKPPYAAETYWPWVRAFARQRALWVRTSVSSSWLHAERG